VGDLNVAHVQRSPDGERRDVQLHPPRDVRGQHLDLDLAQHLVQHAAGVADAVRHPHQVHRDLDGDLLVRVDLVEVDVRDLAADRRALDLADQRLARRAVDGQVDQRARGRHPGQGLLDVGARQRQRLGLAPTPVQDRGDQPPRAQAARRR
jgi:hypothetical protein